MVVNVAYHLASGKEESSYTEIGSRVGVNNLSRDGTFANGLNVTYAAIGLQCYCG